MRLLGIDYGRVYMGVAIAEIELPNPLKVIHSKSDFHKIAEIVKLCQKERIDKIIIGRGSEKLENHIWGFVKKLQKQLDQEIILVDEDFTSNRALTEMIKNNIPRGKRKNLEHAYAACLIINQYINRGFYE